jgi:hypothetical protein
MYGKVESMNVSIGDGSKDLVDPFANVAVIDWSPTTRSAHIPELANPANKTFSGQRARMTGPEMGLETQQSTTVKATLRKLRTT